MIEEIKKRGTIDYINKYGEKLINQLNGVIHKIWYAKIIKMTGYGYRLLSFFDKNNKPSKLLESVFRQEITYGCSNKVRR